MQFTTETIVMQSIKRERFKSHPLGPWISVQKRPKEWTEWRDKISFLPQLDPLEGHKKPQIKLL